MNRGQHCWWKIGIFVNGVFLFDYRDGVGWNPKTKALYGGPRMEVSRQLRK